MSPRNFAILALATVASIALAVQAVVRRDAPLRAEAAGQSLFPGLLDRLNEVREIRITASPGELTVSATDQGWVLRQKADYPVDQAQVRNLALALANLQLIEAKTADPLRLRRLELDEPGIEGANSRLVELMDASGAPLAAAVVGKASPSLYGGGRGGVYVRRAGDDQAWLAAGELDLPTDAMALLGRDVFDLPVDQVARVVVQRPGAALVTLSRTEPAADFVSDAALPAGRKLDPVKAESLAGALAGLTMSDVRPASEIAATNDSRRVRFETFTGGVVDVTVTALGDGEAAEHWVTLGATASTGEDPGQSADQQPSSTRNLDRWAFKVPAYIAEQLTAGLDQLLAAPQPAS